MDSNIISAGLNYVSAMGTVAVISSAISDRLHKYVCYAFAPRFNSSA
ncbi:MAG: hypothetical protein RRX95_00150 [Oscillospiraceae bacterium]